MKALKAANNPYDTFRDILANGGVPLDPETTNFNDSAVLCTNLAGEDELIYMYETTQKAELEAEGFYVLRAARLPARKIVERFEATRTTVSAFLDSLNTGDPLTGDLIGGGTPISQL